MNFIKEVPDENFGQLRDLPQVVDEQLDLNRFLVPLLRNLVTIFKDFPEFAHHLDRLRVLAMEGEAVLFFLGVSHPHGIHPVLLMFGRPLLVPNVRS